LTLKQGKNVPQSHESATNSSSIAICGDMRAVARADCAQSTIVATLQQRRECLIESWGCLPYLKASIPDWRSRSALFSASTGVIPL
jgi:hypothetical protein